MAKLKDTTKKINETQRKVYSGMSKTPLVGGFSRLLRYPAEFARQVGGIAPALLSEDKASAIEELRTPMYMSQEEMDKMMRNPLVEGASAGTEVVNLIPWASAFKALPSIAGASKATQWVAPKVLEGALTGSANTFASRGEKTTAKDLAVGAGVGSSLNILLGGLGEVGKSLSKVGKRTRASSIGVVKPGESTDDMVETLNRMKNEYGGVPMTAQGVIDKTAKKIAPLGEKKIAALSKITKSTEDIGTDALSGIEKSILKSARPESLITSPAYNDSISAIANAAKSGDPKQLDDLAIQLRNLVPYDSKDPTDVVNKEMYDAAADAIVESLKKVSPGYRAAKEGLSKVLGDNRLRETVKAAASEVKGTNVPLAFNVQTPVPRQAFSLLGSLTGEAEQGVGNILGSDVLRRLGVIGGSRAAAGLLPQTQQSTQQPVQPGAGSGIGGEMIQGEQGMFEALPEAQSFDSNDEISQMIDQAFGEVPQGAQQDQSAQARQALAMGVLAGEISATDAKMVLELLGLQEPAVQKLTEKQKLFKSAGETAGQALAILESGEAKTGKLQGVGTAFGKFFGTQDPAQTEYLSKLDGARMAAISALSGANVPPSEYERMRNLIPEPNDEYNVAVQKLRAFQQVMDTYAQSYGTETGATSEISGLMQALGLQ